MLNAGTRINRVVNFRGFLPDKKGEPGDRLYYVTDLNTEKAEQVRTLPDQMKQNRN